MSPREVTRIWNPLICTLRKTIETLNSKPWCKHWQVLWMLSQFLWIKKSFVYDDLDDGVLFHLWFLHSLYLFIRITWTSKVRIKAEYSRVLHSLHSVWLGSLYLLPCSVEGSFSDEDKQSSDLWIKQNVLNSYLLLIFRSIVFHFVLLCWVI